MGITFLLPTSIPDLGQANPALLNCHLLKIFEQHSFIYAMGWAVFHRVALLLYVEVSPKVRGIEVNK